MSTAEKGEGGAYFQEDTVLILLYDTVGQAFYQRHHNPRSVISFHVRSGNHSSMGYQYLPRLVYSLFP